MKNINLLVFLFISIVFVGCKENEAKHEAIINKVIDETTENVEPHASDTHFKKALASLKEDDLHVASEEIRQGVEALLIEGKDVSGLYRVNLNRAIAELNVIAKTLSENNYVSEETLREEVANAEINIAHKYLGTDGVYVLTSKDKVKDHNLRKAFDHNLKSLEEGTSKLEGDAKKEGEQLDAEGKKLKNDYEAWQKRVEDHSKRVAEYFRKYQPENNVDRVYAH